MMANLFCYNFLNWVFVVSLFVLVCMLCIFLSSSLHFFLSLQNKLLFWRTPIWFFFFLFDIIQCSYLSDIHCCVSVAVLWIVSCAPSITIRRSNSIQTVLQFIVRRLVIIHPNWRFQNLSSIVSILLFSFHILLTISSNYVYVKVRKYCITNTHIVYTKIIEYFSNNPIISNSVSFPDLFFYIWVIP